MEATYKNSKPQMYGLPITSTKIFSRYSFTIHTRTTDEFIGSYTVWSLEMLFSIKLSIKILFTLNSFYYSTFLLLRE